MSSSSKKKLRKEQAAEGLTKKQLDAQKEAQSLKKQTLLFIVVLAIVVCTAAATLIVRGYRNSGIQERNTVAMTINDHSLSSAEFNYFYIDAINSFYKDLYNNYGSSTSYYVQMMYGLDFSTPLDQQYYDQDNSTTWADYFMDMAKYNAQHTYAIYDEAMANSYTMSQDEQDYYDSQVNAMPAMAENSGFKNLKSYLKNLYGNGATEKTYKDYFEVNTIANFYNAAHADSITYTDDEIRAYDAEHVNDYTSYTYASYYLSKSGYLTGGTTDDEGNTTYSDEEQKAAVEAAKQDADQLVAAATSLEALDAAIAKLEVNAGEEDAASTKNVDKFYNTINSTHRDWLTDSARKAGDVTCIPYTVENTDDDGNTTTSVNGYYILYFQGTNDNKFPLVNVRHILIGFEGGTQDANGNTTYSDEEKAAAKETAEALLAQWEAGEATEDSFAALAQEKSTDTGSKENGGLYTDIYPGEMVSAFNDWCFESGRQAGDTGIVETEYGYHIMYFSSFSDILYRDYMITNTMRSEDLNAWQTSLYDSAQVTEKDFSLVNTGLVLSGSY